MDRNPIWRTQTGSSEAFTLNGAVLETLIITRNESHCLLMYDVTAYRNLLRCCNRVWNQRKQPETNNAYYRNFLLTHVLSRFFWDELFKILFRKNFLLLPLLALSETLLLTRAPLVYDLCLGLICSWSVRLCGKYVHFVLQQKGADSHGHNPEISRE